MKMKMKTILLLVILASICFNCNFFKDVISDSPSVESEESPNLEATPTEEITLAPTPVITATPEGFPDDYASGIYFLGYKLINDHFYAGLWFDDFFYSFGDSDTKANQFIYHDGKVISIGYKESTPGNTKACYWINDEIHYLSPDIDEASMATDICYNNGDLYISGYIGNIPSTACYWLNGNITYLEEPSLEGSSKAMSIYYDTGERVIMIIGYSRDTLETRSRCYWYGTYTRNSLIVSGGGNLYPGYKYGGTFYFPSGFGYNTIDFSSFGGMAYHPVRESQEITTMAVTSVYKFAIGTQLIEGRESAAAWIDGILIYKPNNLFSRPIGSALCGGTIYIAGIARAQESDPPKANYWTISTNFIPLDGRTFANKAIDNDDYSYAVDVLMVP
ncbi:MAG: hypothetical protein JXR48_04875 [Candidatus Delongbacteria bacterium]|nr:hypothetical protein [Candidatus Delongbacteria bacterium]